MRRLPGHGRVLGALRSCAAIRLAAAGWLALAAAGCRCEREPPPTPAAAPAPPEPPRCPSDDWTTYAHDARRTATSRGCCSGQLERAWTFRPETGGDGRKPVAEHVVVGPDAIYVTAQLGQSPALYKLDPFGNELWRFDSRVDIYRAEWPTLAHGVVFQNDDGLYPLDDATGKLVQRLGLDSWGQTLADSERFYAVNRWHIEGFPVFVGALDQRGSALWKRNTAGIRREDVRDVIGGIALDNGTLFFAARYLYTRVLESGVYAFDPATGEQRWSQPTEPRTQISAGNGAVYLVEKGDTTSELRARAQETGSVLWSVPLRVRRRAAPVLADGKVIVVTASGELVAVDASTGKRAWTQKLGKKPVPPRRPPRWSTTIAAAAGSQTLVVTEDDAVSVHSLKDGSEKWRGSVAGARHLHSPVIGGGRVYVSADGAIHALGCRQ